MKTQLRNAVGLLLIVLGMSTIGFAETLQIAIDYYPPFEYEENGEAKGIGTEVVRAVLQEVGMEAEITQYPFARAYNMVTAGKKPIFYYSLVRTPQREELVQWVGVVAPAEQVLLALKDRDIQISSLEDLKPYSIGTVFEDIVDQYLLEHKDLGVTLDRVAKYDANMLKLVRRRFDLWGGNKSVGLYLLQSLGYDQDEVKVVYEFEELKGEYYFVASKAVPEAIVEQLRQGFATIHANGTYKRILREYFQEEE